jgi:two-component system, NtrC family, sensor kinase
MDHPVFILSLEHDVLYANAAAVRDYGYVVEELVGRNADTLSTVPLPIPPEDIVQLPNGHGRTQGDVHAAEQMHRRKDGTQFPASVALSVIREHTGLPVGYVLSVRDTTEERRIAEQLRQSEKLAALGELVAGVAHELNNPLAGISAFAQLMMEEEMTGDQHESIRLIKREADRAVSVIRDLLVFSRKAGPATGPVDVNGLVQLSVRLRGYSLRTVGVEVETDLATDLPLIEGDDQKLQQVMLNLIVNAEYAMRGTREKRLILRTARHDANVVLEVIDTGTGMSADVRARIFEPFFTTKPAGVGTGLGLSVSYGIIDAHGGTIDVQSEIGRGTVFRIQLPLSPANSLRSKISA